MWAYGHYIRTEDADDGHMPQAYAVEVEFDQFRKIQEIIRVEFSSFQCVIFRCKWWDTFDRNNVKEYRDSELICINSRKIWDEAKEPYVFPKHCNQVFFYPYVLDRD
jgi:hypothetical protein